MTLPHNPGSRENTLKSILDKDMRNQTCYLICPSYVPILIRHVFLICMHTKMLLLGYAFVNFLPRDRDLYVASTVLSQKFCSAEVMLDMNLQYDNQMVFYTIMKPPRQFSFNSHSPILRCQFSNSKHYVLGSALVTSLSTLIRSTRASMLRPLPFWILPSISITQVSIQPLFVGIVPMSTLSLLYSK